MLDEIKVLCCDNFVAFYNAPRHFVFKQIRKFLYGIYLSALRLYTCGLLSETYWALLVVILQIKTLSSTDCVN